MEISDLFSHPDVPEFVLSGERSTGPADYPIFSDRPEKDPPVATPPSS
jgi:hypothetical protein